MKYLIMLLVFILFAGIIELIFTDPDKVVIDNYVGLTDTTNGIGIYAAHWINGDKVLILDTVCAHGVGDTIVPHEILQEN